MMQGPLEKFCQARYIGLHLDNDERDVMFGTQEILIISAIVVGVIFIPRMMNPKKPAPQIVRPTRKKLTGKGRLAGFSA